MHKKFGAVLLVAGTCIGSGMIALPMVMAKIGIIPSVLLMLFIWFIMYYTSLINLELNLQVGHGLSLGSLAKRFSGKKAELVGTLSLKLLSYSLLAVFIYGGSSIVQELSSIKMGTELSFNTIAISYSLAAASILLFPIKWIDYFNRLLFISLLAVVAILLVGLAISIQWTDLPLVSQQYTQLSTWTVLLPVVFTSFGFQVIFHTLANYCKMDAKMLKQAFFWGSLIPAMIYILWTCSLLSVVYHDNPAFYNQMAVGNVEIGELIQVLSRISKWQSVQILIWWISLLAVTTSILGVGIGLFDSMKRLLASTVHHRSLRSVLASILTILPAYLVVIYVPNAFIAVLGFAGMILAVIAVLLPVYLFRQIKIDKLHYPELKNTLLIQLSVVLAVIVILCELYNML